MILKLTGIEFDFEDDLGEELDLETQDEVYDSVMFKTYEVEDEEELADVISDETGWCIKSLDYELVTL